MNAKQPLRLLAGVGILLLAAAACGGAGPTATPQPTPTPQPAATPRPTTAPLPTATAAPAATATRVPTAVPQATATPVPTPRPTLPPATATVAPAPAGQLRIAFGVMGFQLLPEGASQSRWQEPLYDKVLGVTAAGEADESGFVTSFKVSPDSRTWTFQVRKDVVFHNGDKATSKDVKFTLDFYADPKRITDEGNYIREKTTTELPDDGSFIVRVKESNFLFAKQFLSQWGVGPMSNLLPKAYMESVGPEAFNKSPVGSGPFKLKEVKLSEALVYEAVDNHWFYKRPRFKTLEIAQVAEETTRLALLRSGRMEVVEIGRSKGPEMRRGGFNIFVKEGAGTGLYFLHQQHSTFAGGNPLGNLKVREALDMAIDRKTIVDTFLQGLAKASVDYPVQSWELAYKPHPVTKYDPDRARQLIKDAGYPNGFPLEVSIYSFFGIPEGPEIMEAIAVWWEKVGVKVNRTPIEWATFRNTFFTQGFTKPTASGVLLVSNRTNATASAAGGKSGASRTFEDETLERLGTVWRQSTTLEEYVQRGQAVQNEYIKQVRGGPLFEAGETYAADPKVGTVWDLGKFAYSVRVKALATGTP